ncbi:hypothetical protein H2199_002141 [Coniosporium tulheliwenetii]|uniref:Uncharacterized protein n=1 Tax=Coniosporium tulheliwenetii TaxID=3383036 RepID=A0ACC2ZHZ9_9PEZI|nr:hypothetical protein H2199_002141 [Cladosporium sp. JES 115]
MSQATGRPYKLYNKLDHDKAEIRILTIHPSWRLAAPRECTLSKASLSDKPVYGALSYVWGDPSVTTPIIVNGVEVQVTTNLDSALRHICQERFPLILWVDAICINQEDLAERSQQVQLMGKIYSQAEGVMVWLGEAAEKSDLALAKIEEWTRALLRRGIRDVSTFKQKKPWLSTSEVGRGPGGVGHGYIKNPVQRSN